MKTTRLLICVACARLNKHTLAITRHAWGDQNIRLRDRRDNRLAVLSANLIALSLSIHRHTLFINVWLLIIVINLCVDIDLRRHILVLLLASIVVDLVVLLARMMIVESG